MNIEVWIINYYDFISSAMTYHFLTFEIVFFSYEYESLAFEPEISIKSNMKMTVQIGLEIPKIYACMVTYNSFFEYIEPNWGDQNILVATLKNDRFKQSLI